MKEIRLTQGKTVLVDDEDFKYLSRWRWHAAYHGGGFYARRSYVGSDGKTKKVHMSRFILDAPKGMHVDHKNGNTLDNRKENLRIVTVAENNRNRKPYCKSGFKGVWQHGERFVAQ